MRMEIFDGRPPIHHQTTDTGDIDPLRMRLGLKESQRRFWARFGVTQYTGSRYERDRRGMPPPVRILLTAFAQGALSDSQLGHMRVLLRIDGEPGHGGLAA